MLNAIIRFSLRHRAFVVLVCLFLLGYGAFTAAHMPIDVFPDLDRPRVTIMTESHGLAPEEVETLVTYPVESAMLGASGVQDVRTQSGFGLSVVVVEFGWGTDIKQARQTVQERLSVVAADLPPEIRPQMSPVSSILGQFLIAGLRARLGPNGGDLAAVPNSDLCLERVGDAEPKLFAWKVTDRRRPDRWVSVPVADVRWSEPEPGGDRRVRAIVDGRERTVVFTGAERRDIHLRTLADWVVRPRLLKISGLSQVIVLGGGRKQYQVLVDPTALHEYSVSLQDVERALQANNVNYTGGFSDRDGLERPIRVIGRLGPQPERVVADLRRIPVKANAKRPILLENVARVVEAAAVRRGEAGINGAAGVALTVIKQPHHDTRALSAAVQAALDEIEPTLPVEAAIETSLYEQRDFIDRGIANVGEALVLGAGLVLVILFLFLLNVRTTFISLAAIPLSLAITALVFQWIGLLTGTSLSINIMTLGGIAVAMGELVDDAIVDVENIFRRLRENAHLPEPLPALRVVYEASAEIRSSIVFGTAVVILVFLPLFALSGMEGRLFTPLGIAYIVSILASLVVSLTVTPVLAYYLLARSRAVHAERDGWLLRALKWAMGHVIRFSMKRAGLLLLATWLAVGYSAWRLTQLGGDFLPPFDEGTVQLSTSLPAGSSLGANREMMKLVDAKLRAWLRTPENPNGMIRSFIRKTGRAEMDEHVDPPNASDIIIQINPDCGLDRAEVLETIQREVAAEVPGVEAEIEQPLAHLISENLTGSKAQIAIKVFGDDLDELERLTKRIRAVASGVPGVGSLAVEQIRKVDEIHIRLRPDDLALFGLDRAFVGQFVQTALNGEVVSQVIEGQRRFDLLVRLDEPYRAEIGNLKDLRLELPDGRGAVRLGEIADVTPPTGGDSGANQLKRENVRRRIVVRCNAVGRDLVSVVADIRAAVARDVPLPEGYFVEYGGLFENQRRATRLIAVLALVSFVGMFFTLLMLVPSVRIVLQILNAIPTAFIGGVLALVLTGQTLTVASLVGFISLGGIAVRNGILLVTHYTHLMRREGEPFSQTMILRGSLERLAPVLMTALTAGIALVPLVVAGHQPGREILYPVATVILGGLVTSTFCEFLIHPGLFWRFSGASAARLAAHSEPDGLDEPAEPIPLHVAPGLPREPEGER
ncbi:MAG: efflux RND transporter permease subunit [Gemmataceae bacterium]|nr:efflux RND transporter permease subunit [Gemmataceae bacterium]